MGRVAESGGWKRWLQALVLVALVLELVLAHWHIFLLVIAIVVSAFDGKRDDMHEVVVIYTAEHLTTR